MEGYSLIVICVECRITNADGSRAGVLMRAVGGSYVNKDGFTFQCPSCRRKVALAHVEDRYAKKIKVCSPEVKKKRKPYRR